ncbi:MAG: hypothetical protein ACTS80_00720 [Candidatus Hodgkinia cicadicola]
MVTSSESKAIAIRPRTEVIRLLDSKLANCYTLAPILSKKSYTPKLFSFEIIKPPSWTFKAGSAFLIGLITNDEFACKLHFACSPSWSNVIEFYLAKSPNDGLSTFLQKLTPLNSILIKTKTFETLNLKALASGSRLFLLCSEAGVAPLASIMLEPEVYAAYKQVIIVCACRYVNEFNFLNEKLAQLKKNRRLMALAKGKARFYTSTTRERSQFMGRLPNLIVSGKLTTALGGPPFNANDRFMVCGVRAFVATTSWLLTALGFKKGTKANPQSFVCANISAN